MSLRWHPHPCPSPQGGGKKRRGAGGSAPSSLRLRSLAFAGGRRGGPGVGALLGLLARNGLLRVVARAALHEAGIVEEAQDAVGRLGALGEPGLDLVGFENQDRKST